MSRKHLSCTSILIGKDASLDGSNILARNEDYYTTYGPKKYVVRPAKDQPNNVYVSPITKVKIPLPSHAYRYVCEPSTCELKYEHLPQSKYPVYEEAGVNEKNVAMSATETTYSNSRFLGCDPLVKHGINEDSMIMITLPFINNARQGVQRLGRLIEKYGTGQSNGISFADKKEIWYMETAGGHCWVAQRIPDDCYAVIPNQISIQDVDFNDPKNFMTSPGLKEFVARHRLNPDPKTFNFRNIAGTHTEADAHYNTPRAWYGQRLFSHDYRQKPTSQRIPFVRKPYRKLSVEDAEYFLSSHYQQTPYDPVKLKKPVFRPIAIDRNQMSHVIQIRPRVDPKYSVIEWVAMGLFAYSPYVPFYTNILTTPKNYRTATDTVDLNSAFWLYKTLAALVNPHYHEFIKSVDQYRRQCQIYANHRVEVTDQKLKHVPDDQVIPIITKASCRTADHVTRMTHELIGHLIKRSLASRDFHY